MLRKVITHLWFDDQAEAAVTFYTSVFGDSRVIDVQHYGEAGPGVPGSIMRITFELAGQAFMASNGAGREPFTESVSLYVDCATQAEVDQLWSRLSEGGREGRSGWLTDQFGLAWQIIPKTLPELLADPDPARAARVREAALSMRKLDIERLRAAHARP